MSAPLLEVRDLVKHFEPRRRGGAVHAVDGISFAVEAGETFGIVGESGCGKTTTARLVTRLLAPTSGSIAYGGEDVTCARGADLKAFRREVQMVFQDPYSSLNPRRTAGSIVAEPLRIHRIGGGEAERRRAVAALLERVGLSADHANRYPHQLSGGQRQRVGIARALALAPRLLVADEPVSSLDVSIQAQILNLLSDLRRELGLTIVLIAHDLSVVRHMCDRIAVMYLGKLVEVAAAGDLYTRPRHPYTDALLSAVPGRRERARRVTAEAPADAPAGCRFHPRCPRRQPLCEREEPPLAPKPGGGAAACHFPLPVD